MAGIIFRQVSAAGSQHFASPLFLTLAKKKKHMYFVRRTFQKSLVWLWPLTLLRPKMLVLVTSPSEPEIIFL